MLKVNINILKRKSASVELLFLVVLIFPISTVLSDNGILNKVLFSLLVLFVFGAFIQYRISKRAICFVSVLAVNLLYTFFQTQFPPANANLLFYYPFFVVFTVLFLEHSSEFVVTLYSFQKVVIGFLWAWTLLVGISIFMPRCYYIKEGGASYFGSYTESIFRLGPSAVCLMCFVLVSMSFFRRKNSIFFSLIPLYCGFMGSSRVYLVVIGALFLIALYWYLGVKRFFQVLFPLIFVCLLVLLFSPMKDKIIFTLDRSRHFANGEPMDFWYRVTSSRSSFWKKDLIAWSAEPILNRLLGAGVEFTYLQSGLWAHNDFIEILCSFGIAGVLEYVWCMFLLFKKHKIFKTPFVVCALLIFTWLFNALFNMHYTYFCCVLGFPFAIMAVEHYYKEEIKPA